MDDQSKACSGCGLVKPRSEFYPKGEGRKVQSKCKECVRVRALAWKAAHPTPRKARKVRRVLSVEERLWRAAKKRAGDKKVPFSITAEDIKVPVLCPALGIPLVASRGEGRTGPRPGSPTLDRLIPRLGYVPGNIIVLSHLANSIKFTATSDQVLRVGEWLRGMESETKI